MTEQTNELATINEDLGSMAELIGFAGRKSFDNFPGEALERMELEMQAQSSEIGSLRDNRDRTIAIKYWYVHPVEMIDTKTGNVEEGCRSVVITPSGEAFSAVSMGVAKSLCMLFKYFGSGPLPELCVFKIIEKQGKRGKFLTLDYVKPTQDMTVDLL